MRYEVDENGYVSTVVWGCNTGSCVEYEGNVPTGYTNLVDWSENANINAYYIYNGNLILDSDRDKQLEDQSTQDTIDYSPVLHNELFNTNNAISNNYKSETAIGTVFTIDNVKNLPPILKITNIDCYLFNKIDVVTQGKNMLKNDAYTQTISGVTFTKRPDGSIKINGVASANIEYNISGGVYNNASVFSLKKDLDYYLNLGGYSCEMKYYDGETTQQVYVGDSGLINISESKEITQLILKIPTGTIISEVVIYPQLELGSEATDYIEYKQKILSFDFSNFIGEALFPIDDLYPSDSVYPLGDTVDYILIENGTISISVNNSVNIVSSGNVGLFDGFNTIYTLQDTSLEMNYTTNVLELDDLSCLQGKATTTNKFEVLEDGSIKAHDGEFSGNIYLTGTNSKIISDGEGVITNLIYPGYTRGSMITGSGDYLPLGYVGGGSTVDTQRNNMIFAIKVPENFIIKTAKLYLFHSPITWEGVEETNIVGNSRNLKLYKTNNLSTLNIHLSPDGLFYNTGVSYTEIKNSSNQNVLGSNGFTGSWETTTSKESDDFASSLSTTEMNYLTVMTSNASVQSTNSSIFGATGGVFGYIEIIGYKKA